MPGDPTVKHLVELYKKLEDVAKEGSAIKGWHPLRFNSMGWVVAGKRDADGIYRISEFAPIGEWKKAAEYLALENELRALLFSRLIPEEMDAFRTGVGLPSLKEVVERQQEEGSSNDAQ